jgi:hypothetical protein
MVNRRELRWFGVLNYEGWQQEALASIGKRAEGSRKAKDRIGRAYVKTDVEKKEAARLVKDRKAFQIWLMQPNV